MVTTQMKKTKRSSSWPLSQDELKASKHLIIPHLSFQKVAHKYSKQIEFIGTSNFTHRCICPSSKHKNGNERTPSFYFSEETKSFRCFGCSLNGDIFDLIALMEGMPWYEVVNAFLKTNGIDARAAGLDFTNVNIASFANYFEDINLKLSVSLRDHLLECESTSYYENEKEWVDLIFKRVDSRLSKIRSGDKEALKTLEFHIFTEIERRKLKIKKGVL